MSHLNEYQGKTFVDIARAIWIWFAGKADEDKQDRKKRPRPKPIWSGGIKQCSAKASKTQGFASSD